MLYAALAISILVKIFWVEVSSYAPKLWPRLLIWGTRASGGWKADLWAAAAIFLIIYMPHCQAVVAQFYMGDQFHNWDLDCLGPVYGLMSGLKMDIDVYSQYGFGIPVLMAMLMKLFGGFAYVNAIKSIMWLGIAYYIVWFFTLRQWFYSGTIAFAAILFGIRVQMFPAIVIPNVFVEPVASVLRFCFDALFFCCLYSIVCVTKKENLFIWRINGGGFRAPQHDINRDGPSFCPHRISVSVFDHPAAEG